MSSPESDICSIECFQNYTAPEVFIQGLAGQVHQQDVEAIIRAQKQMLQRFEKTNEMLSNCNSLSATRFQLAQKEFRKHTALLNEMKKDLDNVFKRIRSIKAKLSTHYPDAYTIACKEVIDEEEEATYKAESIMKDEKLCPESTNESGSQETKCTHKNDQNIEKTVSSSDSQDSSSKVSSSSSFDN